MLGLFGRTFAAGLLLIAGTAQAQISVTAFDTPVTQNFDALPASGSATWTNNVTLAGGFHARTGTGTTIVANDGGSNAGNLYSYGTGTATDRAIGSLGSGNAAIGNLFWGVRLQNNTGGTITSLTVSFTGEQWRNGAAAAQTIAFSYLVGSPTVTGSLAEFQSAGTAVAALNFTGPITGGTAGALNGNAAANRVPLTATITGLNIPSGTEIMLRWSDPDHTGTDHGLAIDDLTVTAHGNGGGGTPALSISDTAAAEGNSGATPFLFTLSLSAPAGAGGVSIDYATADGTATAGSDYVAKTANVVIPAGSSSVTIGVDVNGDTVTEPNETFFVNLTAATGANIGDGQGVGTINNDDVAIVPIHDIQGNNDTSPLVGQSVTTRGIVTGRRSNGFFLQAPDADADADPATSEGVFVFTGAAPPATAAIGNRVIVSGTVIEFVPAADPGQLNLTEISSPTVTLLDTGNPLPTPVTLTPTFPDPAGPLDQLERLEGMRVTAASFTVVAATGGSTNEPNATGTSNGQLNLVVTGTARPFREPGIQAPDPAPGGGSIPPIPRWDFNPELLFSDTDALGGPRYDLAVGATLTNYVGPLDYGFRRYSVHQDPTVAPAIVQGPAPSAARAPTASEFTYASYNVERFFDTANDPATDDPVLSAAAFSVRLGKASLGIRESLHSPDILGLVEVENLNALQAIATRVNADAVAAGQPDPQYVAYLQEGNDVGGIDVGFLVKTAEVAAGTPRVEVLNVVQLGKTQTWTEPSGGTSLLNDRPPLLMDAVVHYADGRAAPVTAIVVHQRSLNGAEDNTADGLRVRAKRQRQAEYLATQIDAMQDADPDRNIIVAGDFNAFEFNDGLTDAMGTVTGLPSPDNTTAVPGDGADLVDQDLLNLFGEEPADQRYSFEFDGNAQSLDHILINQALGAAAGSFALDHARINADFPEINRNAANSPSRLSDHDPAMAYFSLASADLSIAATAAPASVNVGGAMTFGATVTNNGPDAAAFPGVGFAFDAVLPGLSVTAPAGWTCDAPVVNAGTTTVACATASLANAGTAAFQLTANAPASESGNAIAMVASVDAETYDPQAGNDSASASIQVIGGADLAVTITGPATLSSSAFTANYVVQVANNGMTAAAQTTLTVSGNTLTSTSTLTAPAGWLCTKVVNGRMASFACSRSAPLAPGASASFALKANVKPTPASGIVTVTGTAASSSPDDDASDNSATFSSQVQ